MSRYDERGKKGTGGFNFRNEHLLLMVKPEEVRCGREGEG
jgi:hypothetical protein